ncbi:IclR family transcriptional regulator [Virgibacillus kimchii]
MAKLKTLENALKTLNCFTYKNPTWGVRELGRETGLNHSVVYRILSTFEEFGYLRKSSINDKYELGFKHLEFAGLLQDHLNIPEVMQPKMKELTDQIGESTVLTWLDGDEGVYINIVESAQRVKFHESLGARASLVYGASHKIILAYLAEEDQDRIISFHLGEEEKAQTLKKELGALRTQGWAYSSGEYLDGVTAIAVPLYNRNEDIIGSLSIAGPSFRIPYEKSMEYLVLLRKTQEDVQYSLNKILF